MEIKIFEKLELLVITKGLSNSFPNIDKIIFLNVSFSFSGNFMIITCHSENDTITKSDVYNLDTIKSYKLQ